MNMLIKTTTKTATQIGLAHNITLKNAVKKHDIGEKPRKGGQLSDGNIQNTQLKLRDLAETSGGYTYIICKLFECFLAILINKIS